MKKISGLVAFLVLGIAAPAAAARWQPPPGTTWQLQLDGRVDTSVHAEAFDIDGFDNGSRVVDDLHAKGSKVVCYLSAGSWERWRPDAAKFPDRVRGRRLEGWPGERWLDVRKLHVLKPLMRARLDICVRKGFDAVDFDNVDGYQNRTGFPIGAADQLAYDRWLAAAAHERGLSVGLKNDLRQVRKLEPHFDFAVNEECFQYRECGSLRRFVSAGKAVFQVEYELSRSEFCDRAAALRFSSMRKRYSLHAWRRPCRA